ncbi:MAG: site-specific DNA-methyltransferase [Anaerolineae bacterium]|nr:site-specific DNA-methyltransferase [Anaerolineae bacterium]MCO5191179.1 site-specific DNA-methyltransferase [Anaerolineae bacterium]
MARGKAKKTKKVASLRHGEAKRPNIPTAEMQGVVTDDVKTPIQVAYERRNPDLDPQLVWRGKDMADWSDLVVQAPPLYIQEKVHPKALIDDLLSATAVRRKKGSPDAPVQLDLFGDFNGIPDDATATDFYRHSANWTNRLILGDSLQVMASLAEREGLRGQVQCIYIDPPYGIKFNSNFQWSTTSRDVKDGKADHITREPEQVKAFRDTWRDGIHSYLTYLRDRLTVARDLLTNSGSVFVQIGDENVHRVRSLMDEVFGETNFVSQIAVQKTGGFSQSKIGNILDHVLWYAKNSEQVKYRPASVLISDPPASDPNYVLLELADYSFRRMTKEERERRVAFPPNSKVFRYGPLKSDGANKKDQTVVFEGEKYLPGRNSHWKSHIDGMYRLIRAGKIIQVGKTIYHRLYWDSFSAKTLDNIWLDTQSGGFNEPKVYVVQTTNKIIQRCILMTTDPGDIVLDPTCGSGTSAAVAEQWARRWITVDTSRVALALARARLMGARYPYYLLADSPAGQEQEAAITRSAPSSAPTFGDIRHGFVYQRVPHIMLKDIANNAAIDVIWEAYQEQLEPLRARLNAALGRDWEEWEIPREPDPTWPHDALVAHERWWEQRIARQQEIDASIAAAADQEYLYDQPYEDRNTVRVAGPFTVESISPHRVLTVDADDELQPAGGSLFKESGADYAGGPDFAAMILDNLKTAGVQQAHKADRITFTALTGWPGEYICAEGRYLEGESGTERRAGIFIGPEFGTVARQELVRAAREAADAGFDVLIACAFNYDAHSAEFERLGRIPILKARMNADLHMADALKNTGQGNLFVIFGEPDIEIRPAAGDQIEVEIHGVDIFHPQSGEVRSAGPDDIACWFIDTDYNDESFFVRHAYFLGAGDPYKSLKTTLKAEIDREAWESLHSAVSRPFDKPGTGRIAVKVINHLGDEVMKVFSIG